jgi:hypothetical protein
MRSSLLRPRRPTPPIIPHASTSPPPSPRLCRHSPCPSRPRACTSGSVEFLLTSSLFESLSSVDTLQRRTMAAVQLRASLTARPSASRKVITAPPPVPAITALRGLPCGEKIRKAQHPLYFSTTQLFAAPGFPFTLPLVSHVLPCCPKAPRTPRNQVEAVSRHLTTHPSPRIIL